MKKYNLLDWERINSTFFFKYNSEIPFTLIPTSWWMDENSR